MQDLRLRSGFKVVDVLVDGHHIKHKVLRLLFQHLSRHLKQGLVVGLGVLEIALDGLLGVVLEHHKVLQIAGSSLFWNRQRNRGEGVKCNRLQAAGWADNFRFVLASH